MRIDAVMLNLRRCEQGVTLVELLVVVAILGVLAAGGATLFNNMGAMRAKMAELRDEEALRNMIRTRLNCARSIAATRIGTNIALIDHTGQPLAPSDRQGIYQLGGNKSNSSWKIRAVGYEAGPRILRIESMPPSSDGRYRPLFKDVPLYCP